MLLIACSFRTRAQRGIYHPRKREKREKPWLSGSDKVPTSHPSNTRDPGKSAQPGLSPVFSIELQRTPLPTAPALGSDPQAAFPSTIKGLIRELLQDYACRPSP